MNEANQDSLLAQRIIEFVPFLVAFGRTEDPTVLDGLVLPDSWDFGVLWQDWDRVVKGWPASDIADLIKGLTCFEKVFKRGFGSIPPVANLFTIYSSRVNEHVRDEFADWVLANTVNDYSPFGTHNHGARSRVELEQKAVAKSMRKTATAVLEQARFEDARINKILKATERLPNSLRRKDAKAVAALIAKGADVDAVGVFGQSAREIAKELGIESWLSKQEDVI